MVRAAKQLQDVFGEHQDAIVAEERIRGLVTGEIDANTAVAAGRLVERARIRRAVSAL